LKSRRTGAKLKAEGETPHELHVLARMCPERDERGGYVIKIFFEKDRSGVLTGKEFKWPTYETIAPVVNYLCGAEQGRIGSQEEAAERDISAQEAEKEKAERERKDLFEQIRSARMTARTIAQIQTAWSLTNGKKTRLGEELHPQLQPIKGSRWRSHERQGRHEIQRHRGTGVSALRNPDWNSRISRPRKRKFPTPSKSSTTRTAGRRSKMPVCPKICPKLEGRQ
jgi:hypothetical protein